MRMRLRSFPGKEKGCYTVIKIDENYVPAPIETRTVFGITFEQGRNDSTIDESLLSNIVTENKNLPESAKRDLVIALITLKYTQSNSVCYVENGPNDRSGRGAAITHSLHTPCGQ